MTAQHTTAELIPALLTSGVPVVFQAQGPSMSPTLRDGDLVEIIPFHPGVPRPGSILLYRLHDRLILHRCVQVSSDNALLTTIGDAALSGDDRIALDAVLGLATARQRHNRHQRLDTAPQRLYGRLRYATRPLRRSLHYWCKRVHAVTATPSSKSTAATEREK